MLNIIYILVYFSKNSKVQKNGYKIYFKKKISVSIIICKGCEFMNFYDNVFLLYNFFIVDLLLILNYLFQYY